MMRLHDLNIPAFKRLGGLGGKPLEHGNAQRIIGCVNDRRQIAQRAQAGHFIIVIAGGAADQRRMRALHIGFHQIEH